MPSKTSYGNANVGRPRQHESFQMNAGVHMVSEGAVIVALA